MNRRNVLRAPVVVGAAATLAGVAGVAAAAEPRTAARPAGPLQVHVVMYEGVEELDFAAPYEVFCAARFFTDREVDVRYVTAGAPGTVRAAYGTRVAVDGAWDPRAADILLVPGGGYARPDTPGVRAEIRSGVLPRKLGAAPRPGLAVAGVCTGTMLLAAAGLTANRPCTTHHKARPDLEKQGGLLKNARVVDDGDLVTAGGITSGLDLALWLVRRELGADTATGVEAMLEYEARGTVWTPSPVPGR
ncbi:AraC family transcriptional regulator [Streptomyces sp. Sge12]|uniref:DJ-1/PfpI family protein n=1 Tax=Streptomyces sp. Sge12 TaxID=1972846 RepID=UPI0009C36507|nr:DJ-1/PfpI family protein [Streptomyces sp. Sge12]ARE73102.1 AraC family transcriptional regulator [Streptomyces sp. Sge12]